jgi:hypothetical protein
MEAQDRAQIDAGDVFGKVSEAADGFNAGAVRVVEATAGTTVNIARAAAGGENIFAMDPQQLDDGGYTAFKNTQAQFSEASKDLRADPPFAMPSLPSSTEEALARMTPQ